MFLCRKLYKNSRRHFFRNWRERARICLFSLITCLLWMKFKLDVRFSRSLSNYLLNIQQTILWKLFKLLIGESTDCFLDSAGRRICRNTFITQLCIGICVQKFVFKSAMGVSLLLSQNCQSNLMPTLRVRLEQLKLIPISHRKLNTVWITC